MRTTKKITVSAMLVALGAVLLTVGALWDLVDLTAAAVASLLVAFVYVELGSPYTWLTWLATSLICFIIFPARIVWVEYFLIFGIFPIIKAYIERLPRALWLIVKLVYINAVITLLFFAVEFIVGTPFFTSANKWINAGLWLLMNVAFVVYDMFISVMVRLYLTKYRHRFRRFLK